MVDLESRQGKLKESFNHGQSRDKNKKPELNVLDKKQPVQESEIGSGMVHSV